MSFGEHKVLKQVSRMDKIIRGDWSRNLLALPSRGHALAPLYRILMVDCRRPESRPGSRYSATFRLEVDLVTGDGMAVVITALLM